MAGEEKVQETTEAPEEGGFDMDSAVEQLSESLAESGDIELPQGEEKQEPVPEKGEEAPAKAGSRDVAGEPSAAAEAAKVPDTWTKEAKAIWATVPLAAQQEILKREADIAKYVNETRGQVSVAQQFVEMLKPYQQMFQHYNVNVWQHVASLLHGHTTLLFGPPEAKLKIALGLLHDAGVDPQKLARGEFAEAVRQPNSDVQAVLQRIANIEQGMTGVTSRLNAQRSSELDAQVAAFAEDAKHPLFYEVYQDIARLLETGVCSTLDDAYDKAVWGNPVMRLREQERIAAEERQTRTAQGAQKLAGSRRAAAVNVRGQGTGSGAAPAGNWEDSLAGTLQEIKARG